MSKSAKYRRQMFSRFIGGPDVCMFAEAASAKWLFAATKRALGVDPIRVNRVIHILFQSGDALR
jgi:hypothetical protein